MNYFYGDVFNSGLYILKFYFSFVNYYLEKFYNYGSEYFS